MRRRPPVPDPAGPPLPLLIGCCVEVWAEDPAATGWTLLHSARRRLFVARSAWAASSGLSYHDVTAALPSGGPYSAAVSPHRLRRYGLGVDDVPALRAAAVELLAAAAATRTPSAARSRVGAAEGR